ncbi:hypothetical protein KY289_026231 [Solanum tuberosum]|nr:hypothetical protein KY289_026231 [Solanum tuberosum]
MSGCKAILVERFGGRRALTTIAQYFEVNNCSIDKSEHVLPTFWSIMEIFHLEKKKGLMVRKNGMRSKTLQLLFGIYLSNNETNMSIVLQAANEFASLLLTNLTIRGDAHAYSNLEDKVLIGVGSIVMNGPRPVLAKRPNTELSGYVWDPG